MSNYLQSERSGLNSGNFGYSSEQIFSTAKELYMSSGSLCPSLTMQDPVGSPYFGNLYEIPILLAILGTNPTWHTRFRWWSILFLQHKRFRTGYTLY